MKQKAESRRQKAETGRVQTKGVQRLLFFCLLPVAYCLLIFPAVCAQVSDYEGRAVSTVDVVLEGTPADAAAQNEFKSLLRLAAGSEYSAVNVRQSLHDLYASGRIASARVEIDDPGNGANRAIPIRVRFVVQRQIVITSVSIRIGPTTGTPIARDEIRARVNLLQSGRRFSIPAIEKNADEIQTYLRDRGYFNATVEHSEIPAPGDASGTRRIVVFTITPNEQARVGKFQIDPKLPLPNIAATLKLQPGTPFTRDLLGEDIDRIKQALIAQGLMAPQLKDPLVTRDPATNTIDIKLEGSPGPHVEVSFVNYTLKESKQQQLLPLKREGNLDFAVIEEGSRRVKLKLQEEGYFFAEVNPLCTISPPLPNTSENGNEEACHDLNPDQLKDHNVKIVYDVKLNRQLRLSEIRIEGTNKLTLNDILPQLRSRKATAFGFLPLLGGYARGVTSNAMLEEDRRTVERLMKDLGYLGAEVKAIPTIPLTQDSLIITFKVTEKALTRVADIQIQGESAIPEARLREEVSTIKGAPYSPSQVRADRDQLLNLYARLGYIEADVRTSFDKLPKSGEDDQVRVIFHVTREGSKGIVNDIVINGVTGSASTQELKRAAIRRAIPLVPGDILRADRITEAERALYVTDAYRQVIITQQPAGDAGNNVKRYDVIIDLEEKRPRVVEYGGGYSTDTGPLGLLELTNVNFRNRLQQAAMRIRMSQRQQLIRLEFLDPRFFQYRKRDYAPLGLSVQYLRDSTITRFFRSTIDQGTNGVVQRLDENGNPVNRFGMPVGEPTINRFILTAETQRVMSRKLHSILLARYTYEDVRLKNIESLLIEPILRPDQVVRLSGPGVSFVIDTRQRCERRLAGTIYGEDETIRGGEVCRYNQTDATRGQFFNADFRVAARALGGNTSFTRFESSYHTYYKSRRARNTVFAGNLSLGLANLFSPRDLNGNGLVDDFDLLLPISERFFSGGSTTLRGFGFEEAGPRQVIVPLGEFHDNSGKPVGVNPFTVPIGGNAQVIVNLEARIPVNPNIQAVPFYDGGNVFRSINDLLHPKPFTPTGNFLQDINAQNLRVRWSHTVGLGFRFKTPLGGALAVDYGYLLNPSEFLIPQNLNTAHPTTAIYRLHQGQIQFRFTQTF
ncbi:MAG TPA: POTRA domain-containing protein [Pyrinomonadaceae bacterium]|nr:POTRA domain-containing protein [Pyrinomonadaceae bacterium]